ncbi:hypothetical protein BC936DRAFT_143668 [Jimgerdemannia flammicorona]|uniref:Uncharacterized protein n=1 Tax=Jimgerdemannia flammicorona TaxID=994334 RepID=A0A433DDL6_9FUNG|nr:hypothetical protein BC936DRAFT_143668 [Jimgerdemannia flammicorona]
MVAALSLTPRGRGEHNLKTDLSVVDINREKYIASFHNNEICTPTRHPANPQPKSQTYIGSHHISGEKGGAEEKNCSFPYVPPPHRAPPRCIPPCTTPALPQLGPILRLFFPFLPFSFLLHLHFIPNLHLHLYHPLLTPIVPPASTPLPTTFIRLHPPLPRLKTTTSALTLISTLSPAAAAPRRRLTALTRPFTLIPTSTPSPTPTPYSPEISTLFSVQTTTPIPNPTPIPSTAPSWPPPTTPTPLPTPIPGPRPPPGDPPRRIPPPRHNVMIAFDPMSHRVWRQGPRTRTRPRTRVGATRGSRTTRP